MFSLNWFLTPVGILITVGVLLLVAALVIFIVTKNKGKKNDPNNGIENMANAVAAAPVGNTAMATPAVPAVANEAVSNVGPAVDNMVAPATPIGVPQDITNMPQPNGPEAPVVMSEPVEVPNVYSTEAVVADNTDSSTPGVVPAPTEIAGTPTMSVEVPNVYSTEPVVSTEQNVVPGTETPAVDVTTPIPDATITVPSVEEVIPEQQVAPTPVEIQPTVETPQPTETAQIYGGATPTVPEFQTSVAEPQIYGGANPLENTQSVPIADITNGVGTTPEVTTPTESGANVATVVATPEAAVPTNVTPEVPTPTVEIQEPVASAPQVAAYQAATPTVEIPNPGQNIQQ